MYVRVAVVIAVVWAAVPFFVFAAVVSIHEIAWMGTAVSTADEWVELKNDSGASIDMSGWRLEWRDGEYGITFDSSKCVSTAIPAGGYFLLERTDDTTVPTVSADCIYTGALSNSGERVLLKDNSGVIIHEVNVSSGWPAGDNTTKDTMQWNGSSWITAPGTPRAANAEEAPASGGTSVGGAAPESGTVNPPQSSGTSEVTSPAIYNPLMAYAGPDRSAAVGTYVEFDGYATVASSAPVTNVRFWWNFGDGETQEGKNVSHMYHMPGTYTVGLHVSSGEYAASDYATISAVSNLVRISGVSIGDGGYVTLSNPSAISADIGGWIIEDGRRNIFIVPVKTVIGAGAKISFPNSVTKLFSDASAGSSAVLYFPNYAVSSRWAPAVSSEMQGTNANVQSQTVLKTVAENTPPSPPENESQEAELQERVDARESSKESQENKVASTLLGVTPSLGIFFGIALVLSLGGAIGAFFFKSRILP